MAILQGDISTLTLYSTVDLPSSTIDIIKRDFGLGAQEGYNPFCRLEISARKDLIGLDSPEAVLRQLESAGVYKAGSFSPFLVADQRTLEYPEDGVVWFVHEWAQEDDFQNDVLADDVDRTLENGHYKFAHKELIYSYYAPILYVNLEIANCDLAEGYEYPYDPSRRTEPTDVGRDWRFEEPNVAYVVTDKTQYDTITMSEYERLEDQRSTMVLGGAGDKDQRPMYRLKEEVAERLGLVPSWYLGSEFDRWDHGNAETRQRLAKEIGDRSSAVTFAQEWQWSRPAGIKERLPYGLDFLDQDED